MHAPPGALAILAACSWLTLPDGGRQRSAATHVSTWLMASGHVHALKRNFFQKITVWGWNLWFDLSNKLLVLSVPLLIGPATKHPYLGQQMRTRQKNPIDSRELRRAWLM